MAARTKPKCVGDAFCIAIWLTVTMSFPTMAEDVLIKPQAYISIEDLRELLRQKSPDDKVSVVKLSEDVEDKGELVQLLKPGAAHEKLELNQMALDRMSSIEDPVAFVSAVGPYHGGKSFLLNVLLNSTLGFQVGARPEPETRGIWMRIVPKKKLKGVDGSRVILLDTEGFYGEGATRLYDAKIFAIATLLSSHLVYNTLRMLGDAQSVNSLADLSKQAQVFNLQNWLHTATSKEQHSAATDVDTSLLLRTLDFPPLTWVVQGFDMDLQPAETPIDHLQRYIAAHAQSGDRTLDTLFTHGISCYAIRTPADLNKLRESYGSKGLAAEKELFYSLHPKYLSDIEKLRTGVFGNLTAKGGKNLTGKTMASLLPLLVHYVNEDFPLNADRKLRDVLVDVIVEGAFSGGVQYFENKMQAAFVTPGGGKGSRLNLSTVPNNLETLSALASSALTTQELMLVMANAEKKAIDYCKRRCIGVSPENVASACEGHLGVKIDRMKPSYREQNEEWVREVLVLLGEILRAKAETILFDINLPTTKDVILQGCNQVISNALQEYEALVGPHQGSQLYHEACKQMKEEIQLKCDKVVHMNTEKITSILNRAKSAYQRAYSETFSSGIGNYDDKDQKASSAATLHNISVRIKQPLSPSKLAEVHSASLKTAQEAYDKTVKESELSWMGSGNELYDFHQFQALQWSKQQYGESQSHNYEDIKAFCEKLSVDLGLQFRETVHNLTPFPDNDEIITIKADTVARQFLEVYDFLTKDYGFPGAEEKRKELFEAIQNAGIHLLKKNTALMAAFCYDPLMEASRELQMDDCKINLHNMWYTRRFWSLKCLWPGPGYKFGFKYAAYSTARKYLDKAQASARDPAKVSSNHDLAKGVILSPVTQNKVIQAWIDHDLAYHANVVLMNFGLASTGVLTIITAYLCTRKTGAFI